MGAITISARQDIDALFLTHHRRIWLYVRAMGCEAALAEDIVQEAFLALAKALSGSDEVHEPERYLRRTAKNLYFLHLRKHKREVELVEADEAWGAWIGGEGGRAGSEVPTSEGPAMEALARCLEELDERTRDVLRMRYGNGQGRDDMSNVLGIGADGVSKLIYRALAKLRECIERRMDV